MITNKKECQIWYSVLYPAFLLSEFTDTVFSVSLHSHNFITCNYWILTKTFHISKMFQIFINLKGAFTNIIQI